MAAGARWPTSHLSCFPSTGKMFLAGGYLQSVALIRGGGHAYFASPGGIHHGVLDGVTVQRHGQDRDARGEGVPDPQRPAGWRRGLGGVLLALIHAVLTHKSEREEHNVKPKPDLKSEEDCQTEPQRSTSEAEGDGTFDAAAMVTRMDTDRDFEEH